MPQSEIDKLKSGKKESQIARDKAVADIELRLRQQAKDLLEARNTLSSPIFLNPTKISPGAAKFYKKGKAKLEVSDLFDSSGKMSENVNNLGKIPEFKGIPYITVFSTTESFPGYNDNIRRNLITLPVIANTIDNNKETLNFLNYIFNNFGKLTNDYENRESDLDINELADFLSGSILFNTNEKKLTLADGSSLVIRTSWGYA